MRRLERDGAIRGYRADVAPEALGVGLQAFVAAELNAHSRDSHRGLRARHRPGARACAPATTSPVASTTCCTSPCSDLEHLGRLIKTDIAAIPGVAKLETLLVLTEVKADEGWPDADD